MRQQQSRCGCVENLAALYPDLEIEQSAHLAPSPMVCHCPPLVRPPDSDLYTQLPWQAWSLTQLGAPRLGVRSTTSRENSGGDIPGARGAVIAYARSKTRSSRLERRRGRRRIKAVDRLLDHKVFALGFARRQPLPAGGVLFRRPASR